MASKKSPIWHPMTQHGIFPEMIAVDRAEGAYLYREDGSKILDGISSWWVNTHGHCHPKIVSAVQEQAAKLEQVIFAGFTHPPAEALTQKLLAVTPDPLEYVFYSDSGSTAIEVALKMAIGYWEHQGQERHKIIALEDGYHGDTFGTMSTGARGVFNELYEPFLFDVIHLPFPSAGNEDKTLTFLDEVLRESGDDIAAFVFEPLVQGAAGMRLYSGDVLAAMRARMKAHDILLIADEVMTGFGRTGSMFACDEAGIVPDLLCLSKGLTGGFLPMGATLATAEIYDAFYGTDRAKQFFHSTSFTGNPLACAAALASLEIWEQEPVAERIAMINQTHESARARFEGRDDIQEVRIKGTIMAMDIRDEVQGYLSNLGTALYEFYLENDILLRPIGNTVYILPPYCITKDELEQIYDTIERSLDRVKNEGTQRAA